MAAFEILTDDWKKIPQNLRYLIITGFLLIANTWLLDHWGTSKIYTVLGYDIRDFSYSTGFILIFLTFVILIAKQIYISPRNIYYRIKYPISKLNKSFYLVWFNGKLILFDYKKKKYFHVHPWETAQDLLFVGLGEQLSEKFSSTIQVQIATPGASLTIDAGKYKNGGSINTQI